MENKKLIKMLGWTTVLSGIAFVYLSSKEDEPVFIQGFNIDIDADKLVDSGLAEFAILNPEYKDKIGNSAKKLLGRLIHGDQNE